LLADGRVYVHFGHQGTACLDLDGRILWRNSSLDYPPLHGNGGSPILAGDSLVFSCDGLREPFIVALDKVTGKIRWKTTREAPAKKKFSFSTPLLITVNGEQQIISPGSGAVFAYDPKSGREIWRARYGEGYSVIPRPVFGHGLIFISTGYDTPTLMAVRPGGRGDVTDTHVAWSLKKGAPNTPSPLLVGDELYVVSDGGIASCVEARTGKVHWQERVGGNYSASPVHANGRVYFQNEEGTAVVLKASREFQKLGENSLGARTLASYAVTEGALFIRTDAHLYKIKGS
jgi:outer membrane protein assembly factor BamB